MGFDDGPAEREPQARALPGRLRGEERLEDPRLEIGRHPGAVVRDRQHEPVRGRLVARGQNHPARARGSPHRVMRVGQ